MPGSAPSSASKTHANPNPDKLEKIDVKKLSEITPKWLEVPTKYYETLGTNIRGSMFYHIGKDCLEPEQLAFGAAVLNLFQLSAVILDDICDNSYTRRSQPTIHEVHGREKSLVWSFGLCFHIHDYIMKEAPNEEFALKMIRLYDEMASLTLEGQYYDMDTSNINFKQIAELKTSYYTTCFPVAMLVLMKTNDLEAALKVMHNESLLEIGYWFQAENDFKGTFLDTNTDIENKTWTLLIQMLSEKFEEGEFEYPETHEESVKLYKEYDIYDQYVRARQDWLKRLKKMAPEPSLKDRPDLAEIVQNANRFSLKYFMSKYILRGYTFKKPESIDEGEMHPQAEELNKQVQEWAEKKFGAEPMKVVYGELGPDGTCNWVNRAFSFIKNKDIMFHLHRMNLMLLLIEDIATRNPKILTELIEWSEHEFCYPQYEMVVIAKAYGVDEPLLQPLFWELCVSNREIAKGMRTNVDDANKRIIEWLNAKNDLRTKWASITSMDEYYKLRLTALGARMFYNDGAVYNGKKNLNTLDANLLAALTKFYVLQHDLFSYPVELAQAKAAAASSGSENLEKKEEVEPPSVVNVIEMYKKLNSKGTAELLDQDVVDELMREHGELLKYIRSLKGTENSFFTVMQAGMVERAGRRYEKAYVESKTTGFVKLP